MSDYICAHCRGPVELRANNMGPGTVWVHLAADTCGQRVEPVRADQTMEMVEAVDLRRGHPFFPPADEWLKLPKMYSTERVLTKDKLVVLHYFVASADWWIVEVDHDARHGFGFACLGDPQNAEWGNVDLNELAVLHKPGSMIRREINGTTSLVVEPPIIVERDLYWTVRPAGEVEGIKIPGGA